MRVEKIENKEEKQEEPKGQVIEVTEDVRIPDTKIILEKGDKIEIFSKLNEETEVSLSVTFPGVDCSFEIEKEMDYVYDEGSEEPKEVEKYELEGTMSFNIECASMVEVSDVEEAVKAFVNKFAKEKVE